MWAAKIFLIITTLDEFKGESQVDYLESIRESASIAGIKFSWEFDRGLDIFQHYEMNDIFSVLNRLQEFRSCKAFEVTFLRSK